MSLPTPLLRQLEQRFGPIGSVRPVGGGCVTPAVRIGLPDGDAFLKYSASTPPEFFGVEARGLERLSSAGELRVPRVLAVGDGDPGEPGWLLLEWLRPARRGPSFDERLGRGLATLHRSSSEGGEWGWEEDGFIGPLPQANRPMEDWPEFWRAQRLEPQLRCAWDAGRMPGGANEWDHLFARLPGLLGPAEDDGPSLLHGDLWGGNMLAVEPTGDGDAEPALIDPSVYFGHREVDLAMSELFGGFGANFYTAYDEAWPLRPGYREGRRAIYQLYYLLVHVNLFGGGYRAQTARVLRDALRA